MKITINAPSYKRPNKVDTLKYLPSARIWVDEGEFGEYKKSYPDSDIVSCPKGIQGNLCRIRNYILDQEEKSGTDVVALIDDDLKLIGYNEGLKFYVLPDEDRVMQFLEKYSILAMDLGAKLWGINVNHDPQNYREYTPFSLLSYIGGPFMVHIHSDLRYDERLPLKEDYDLTLQHLNKYRKVLRVNKYFYNVKQHAQAGGCADYRTLEREKAQVKLLQKKWGSKIVKADLVDRSHRSRKRRTIDINPVIRVPIRGI